MLSEPIAQLSYQLIGIGQRQRLLEQLGSTRATALVFTQAAARPREVDVRLRSEQIAVAQLDAKAVDVERGESLAGFMQESGNFTIGDKSIVASGQNLSTQIAHLLEKETEPDNGG